VTTKHLSINTVYVVKPRDMRVENIVNRPSRSLVHGYRRPKCPEIQDESTIREKIKPDKAVISTTCQGNVHPVSYIESQMRWALRWL
jgi:hypothetical protein